MKLFIETSGFLGVGVGEGEEISVLIKRDIPFGNDRNDVSKCISRSGKEVRIRCQVPAGSHGTYYSEGGETLAQVVQEVVALEVFKVMLDGA